MKWIKLYEDFDTINSVISNTTDILISLRDYGFNVKVSSQNNEISIEISKNKSEELKVFRSSDISNLLQDSDKYLTLGEGLKLESIFLETIEGSKELQTINSLIRERSGLLAVYISYVF